MHSWWALEISFKNTKSLVKSSHNYDKKYCNCAVKLQKKKIIIIIKKMIGQTNILLLLLKHWYFYLEMQIYFFFYFKVYKVMNPNSFRYQKCQNRNIWHHQYVRGLEACCHPSLLTGCWNGRAIQVNKDHVFMFTAAHGSSSFACQDHLTFCLSHIASQTKLSWHISRLEE